MDYSMVYVWRGRLNPFYFRAGLLPERAVNPIWLKRLNPFYFRAGLLPRGGGVDGEDGVLIPFISGLDCYGDLPRVSYPQVGS